MRYQKSEKRNLQNHLLSNLTKFCWLLFFYKYLLAYLNLHNIRFQRPNDSNGIVILVRLSISEAAEKYDLVPLQRLQRFYDLQFQFFDAYHIDSLEDFARIS